MDRDFTIKKYKRLLTSLDQNNYFFQTFNEYIENPKNRSIVLRHDVDLLPKNSFLFAKLQSELGIKGTYYFRAVSQSWDEQIIKEIYKLGHEIGYHYENLTTCKGDIEKAYIDFKKNLEKLRELVPVNTICMHGSPASKFDSKDLWLKYKYCDLGIIGEPYFDVDFNKTFYLTDTGRRWDGFKVSVRDKVNTTYDQTYHSTDQVIKAIINSELPDQLMFTFHPQRWHDNYFNWSKELLLQNSKNMIKKYFYVKI